MNTDTPTPRTKAATFNARLGNPWKDEVVYASVAETLERELTAARKRIAELEGEMNQWKVAYQQLQQRHAPSWGDSE